MLPEYITTIHAVDIPDAWHLCINALIDIGFKYKIEQGSFVGDSRLEFDFITIQIDKPYAEPYDLMLPQIPAHFNIPNPVANGYVEQYLPYLMTDHIEPGESYTYGSRLCGYPVSWDKIGFYDCKNWKNILIQDKEVWENKKIIIKQNLINEAFLNQIELLIWSYKNKGCGTNQMVLQVAHPNDMLLKDPACLRHIDTRIKDNELWFFPYFRSWDLFSGMPANLAGLAVLQKYIADEIGVDTGPMIASSKGLHTYSYVDELVRLRTGK